MLKDKRNFDGSIRINLDGEKTLFEIANASLDGGDEEVYRVRKNRVWLDNLYSKLGLVQLIDMLLREAPSQKPDLKNKDAVRVHYPFKGINYHQTFLSANPVLTYEGVWVAPLFIYKLGTVYVNCDKMTLIRRVQ